MVTTAFAVEGPTCGACFAELLEQVRAVDGVTGAAADLAVGGSTLVVITSDAATDVRLIRRAVARAGFALTSADHLVPPHSGAEHLAARAFAGADGNKMWKEGVR